jgi:hypothetical protein
MLIAGGCHLRNAD